MNKAGTTEIFPEVFPEYPASDMPRGHGECLLVVDDENDVLWSAQAVLADSGYRVMTASSGAEALKLYVQHKRKIALIIADILMPDMTGPTTIFLLRLINPRVRIIAMSGYAPVSPEVEALHADEEHFLGKPFTVSEILCMIRDTLAEPDHIVASAGARQAFRSNA
jgi:DNA-binding NtrC family response regulator